MIFYIKNVKLKKFFICYLFFIKYCSCNVKYFDFYYFIDMIQDIVDILVGWYIDFIQKDSLIEFIFNVLIEFYRYWVNDILFFIILLGQFLEDMEVYVEVIYFIFVVDFLFCVCGRKLVYYFFLIFMFVFFLNQIAFVYLRKW